MNKDEAMLNTEQEGKQTRLTWAEKRDKIILEAFGCRSQAAIGRIKAYKKEKAEGGPKKGR